MSSSDKPLEKSANGGAHNHASIRETQTVSLRELTFGEAIKEALAEAAPAEAGLKDCSSGVKPPSGSAVIAG